MSGYPPTTTGVAVIRGILGRCPRCGRGKMFAGFLQVAPACDQCGLDLGSSDAGDGPAVFVILIAGFIVAGSALVTEALASPPLWVHALLWGPLAVVLCLGPLRPLKGILIALQYHFQAAEGRRADSSGEPR